jgi:Fanconi-associated nuclease 1
VEVLQKVKDYTEANTVLEELLNQSVHCQHYRGHWWDRLALNLDQHLKKPDKVSRYSPGNQVQSKDLG